MSKRTAGTLFLITGAFLFSIRFLNASLYAVAFGSMGDVSETANNMSPGVFALSILFFILGTAYLIEAQYVAESKYETVFKFINEISSLTINSSFDHFIIFLHSVTLTSVIILL